MIKKDMSFLYIYKILSIFFICIIALNSVYAEEVNIYSARKGYLLEPLIQAFEKDTGIKVNIISGKAKTLQKRIQQEGSLYLNPRLGKKKGKGRKKLGQECPKGGPRCHREADGHD